MATSPAVLFPLGSVVSTPGAITAMLAAKTLPEHLLERHQHGDWGDVPPEDARENELSVREGLRVLSSYELTTGTRVWVITEWDRSATTILLPSEY